MTTFTEPFPEITTKNHKKIKVAKLLSKSLIYAFALFGLIFILILFAVLGMLKPQTPYVAKVPDSAILKIDFDEAFSESNSSDLMMDFAGIKKQSFYDLIKTINIAAMDSRIKALVGEVHISSLGIAQIQDLRQTIENFKKTGKKAYLYSSGFGALGGGTKEYYLATAFDEIVIAPKSEVGITGIGIEVPFFKNVLEKIGVKADFYSRYQYKTAMDSFTSSQMSEPFYQEMDKLGEGVYTRLVFDMAQKRNIPTQQMEALIDQAPLFSEEALEAKLVDKIMFGQDFLSQLKTEYKAKFISSQDYAANIVDNAKKLPTIAFLVIEGIITDGESSADALNSEIITGAETVLKQIEDIKKNKNIKAVVVRVNSPGGSYNASNDIWHALEKLKEEKKIPVIVSMGDYAASGGYFVALAGNKIIAEPTTITGSIGVLGGKFVLEDLWKKLDVNWQRMNFGKNAGILSSNTQFSESEKHIFNKSLDMVYSDFTSKVTKARNISEADMDKLARGRVWLGEQALENHLIDAIGGIEVALTTAQAEAKLKPNEKIRIEFYPKEKTLQEKIQQLLQNGPAVQALPFASSWHKEMEQFNLLNRLKYNAILPPMQIDM